MNENWDEIWNSMAEGMGSNPARKLRQDAILRRIKPGPILDFGAGDGEFVLRMKEKNFEAMGVERSREGVSKANSKAHVLGYGDILFGTDSNFLDKKVFKNIVLSEVVEHIEDPTIVLKSLSKNLAPGGIMIVTVPAGPISKFDRFIGHYRHYSKASLKIELEKANFEVIELQQIGFPVVNLVRIWCLIKGDKVVKSLTTPNSIVDSNLGKIIVRILSLTFHFNSKFGWQLIATAKVKSLPSYDENHS
jgi:cyclopropane fatty-acyl-phospholipid synthase-like methyltransferase